MPTSSNWFYFIYINLAFTLLFFYVFYLTSIEEIKQNWALYRCNPMYMPLSDNIEKDFQYCIQNTQINFMGYLLQPLTFLTSSLSNNAGSFMTEINSIRAMFDKVRTFISTIIQSVFGIFLNMAIIIQQQIISIKDLMGKTIGIMVGILYMMSGLQKTLLSANNGPPGQLVRKIGRCMLPDTFIRIKNKNLAVEKTKIMKIKDIKAGDILEDGTEKGNRVIATMIIDNSDEETAEPLFVFPKAGEENSDIYVTGSHYVYDKILKKFIPVRNHLKALEQYEVVSDWYVCLITENHNIKIKDMIFYDWEDFRII